MKELYVEDNSLGGPAVKRAREYHGLGPPESLVKRVTIIICSQAEHANYIDKGGSVRLELSISEAMLACKNRGALQGISRSLEGN